MVLLVMLEPLEETEDQDHLERTVATVLTGLVELLEILESKGIQETRGPLVILVRPDTKGQVAMQEHLV